MSVKIHSKDLSRHGLTIIRPSDPSFDSEVEAEASLKDKKKDLTEDLKPFSVLIKNSGTKTVIAYTIRWEMTSSTGETTYYDKSYAVLEALTGGQKTLELLAKTNTDRTIKPNKRILLPLLSLNDNYGIRLEGPRDEVEQYKQEAAEKNRAMLLRRAASDLARRYTDITVTLDGVLFDDGTFVGPDSTGLFDSVKAYTDARSDLLNAVSQALNNKTSYDQLFKAIETIANGPEVDITSSSTPVDHYNDAKKLFAEQILQMKRAYGDEKALRAVFAIHGRQRPKLKKLKD